MLKHSIKSALLLAALCLTQTASAGEMTLFTDDNFNGPPLQLRGSLPNLVERGFNDRASSMIIRSGRWELCEHANFGGNCAVFEPGEYPFLEDMHDRVSSVRELKRHGRGVELFSRPGFQGESLPFGQNINDLNEFSFNDRAGSIVVHTGTWTFCEHARMRGQCITLRPGQYGDLRDLDGQISSVKRVR